MPKSRHMHGLTCTHLVPEFPTRRKICARQSIINKTCQSQGTCMDSPALTSCWSFGRVEKSAHVRASSINMSKSRHMHRLTCTHLVPEFPTRRKICACYSIIHNMLKLRHMHRLTCTHLVPEFPTRRKICARYSIIHKHAKVKTHA